MQSLAQISKDLQFATENWDYNHSSFLACHLQEKDTSLYRPALEQLRTMIRASTSSMTSVPKPLKFLRPHYDTLKEIFENMAVGDNKVLTCLLLNSFILIGMIQRPPGSRREWVIFNHPKIRGQNWITIRKLWISSSSNHYMKGKFKLAESIMSQWRRGEQLFHLFQRKLTNVYV